MWIAKSCNLLLSGNRLAQHVVDCRVCVVETMAEDVASCRNGEKNTGCRDGVKV